MASSTMSPKKRECGTKEAAEKTADPEAKRDVVEEAMAEAIAEVEAIINATVKAFEATSTPAPEEIVTGPGE